MIKNQDIIAFGSSDWWADNFRSCNHVMLKLSAANRIIHINPISSDLLGVRSRKGLWRRIARKLRSLLKFIKRVNHNLYVISPIFLPLQGNAFFDSLNNILLRVQLMTVMFFLRIKKPLLWIENPRAADFIRSLDCQLVVYHASDLFQEDFYTHNKEKLRRREAYVSNNSDLIICVSRQLYESKKDMAAKVHYISHGVDFERFRSAAENKERFSLLRNIRGPIAGYFGTLTAQNDIELLQYCAANMKDVTFVFAGYITAGNYSELAHMPNTVFLGWVPYQEIAGLCATFNVCLLPWKMNKWITSSNPLKFWEYMASGKPIVSVPIRELLQYSDLISISHSKEEFSNAVRWELLNDTSERANRRIQIAKKSDWNNKIEEISRLITDTIILKRKNLRG